MKWFLLAVFVLWAGSFIFMLASCHVIDGDWKRTKKEAPEVFCIASLFTVAVAASSLVVGAAVYWAEGGA